MRVNPISFYIPHLKSEVDIDLLVNRAKTEFANLRKRNHLRKLENGVLIYRITDQTKAFKGIVLGVDINHFLEDSIVHHERTIPSKEINQAAIAEEQSGFSKPILLTHRPILEIRNLIQKYTKLPPIFDARLSQYDARHQLWLISDKKEIKRIEQAYEQVSEVYIVDGHHRTEAIRILRNRNISIQHGMCAFFDVENLDILPFHRVINVDAPISHDALIKKLENHCIVIDNIRSHLPEQEHTIHIYYQGRLTACKWKEQILDALSPIEILDVNLVKEFILNKILNIKDTRKSKHVGYLEGNKTFSNVKEIIDRDPNKMAILLHPIEIERLIEITSKNILLPPKSTWFLPRMANGIVTYTFED